MASDIKFFHGLKADIPALIASGKVNGDDLIIAKDTDDELILITHDLEIKPIKARTGADIILTTTDIGELKANTKVAAGSSLDDFINFIKDWLTEHKDAINQQLTNLSQNTLAISNILQDAPEDFNTFKKVYDWISSHQGIFDIVNPVDGQVLLYDATSQKWKNKNLVDNQSIVYSTANNGGLSLKGYDAALQGQIPVKDSSLGIAWVNQLSLAEDFSTTTSYEVGKYVIYQGALWRCVTAHSGEWVESNWVQVLIADEIPSVTKKAFWDNKISCSYDTATNQLIFTKD